MSFTVVNNAIQCNDQKCFFLFTRYEHDTHVFSEPDGRRDEDAVGGVDHGGMFFHLLQTD